MVFVPKRGYEHSFTSKFPNHGSLPRRVFPKYVNLTFFCPFFFCMLQCCLFFYLPPLFNSGPVLLQFFELPCIFALSIFHFLLSSFGSGAMCHVCHMAPVLVLLDMNIFCSMTCDGGWHRRAKDYLWVKHVVAKGFLGKRVVVVNDFLESNRAYAKVSVANGVWSKFLWSLDLPNLCWFCWKNIGML